jgi:hypothetical protein
MSTPRSPTHSEDAESAGLDAHSVSVLLAARIDELARNLLPSGRKEGATWRVGGLDGAKGSSLVIALGGKKGLWIDHATGEKGDALDLVKGVRHCGTREAIEWSKKWLALGGARLRAPQQKAGHGEDEADRIERALAIWDEAVSPRRTLVETYLRTRALEVPDSLAGHVIHFHRACPWRDQGAPRSIFVPAMIVAMRSIETDEITAIQRTRLSQDGKKIARRMLAVAAGAAVKLDAHESVTNRLVIGEGVETAMTARRIDLKPTWALGSAGAISAFPVLDGVERIGILTEDDEANERATEACGGRWYDADRKVLIIRPTTGNDLNDALRAMRRSGGPSPGKRRAS